MTARHKQKFPAGETTRRVGAALAVATALVIAVATLTPQPVSPDDPPAPSPWCLVCYRVGGADVIANVLLFLPLGLGLALSGLHWRRVGLLALLYSAGIETAQHVAIPGRFGTVSDLVTNTLGATLGALAASRWRTVVAPRGAIATWLTLLAAVTWNATTALGAWALGRDPSAGPAVPRVLRDVPIPGTGWFAGRVGHAEADGFTTSGPGGTGPVVIQAAPGRRVHVAAEILAPDRDDGSGGFLAVLGGEGKVETMLAQRGTAVQFEVTLRARRFRLRQPTLRIAGPLAPGAAGPVRVAATYGDHVLALSASRGSRLWRRQVRLAPSMSWALLVPFLRVDDAGAGWYTAAWLVLLTAPLGYGAAWMVRSRPDGRNGAAGAAGGIVATAVVGALVVAPLAGGYAVAPAAEWAATATGLVAGALVARGVGRGAPSYARNAAALPSSAA